MFGHMNANKLLNSYYYMWLIQKLINYLWIAHLEEEQNNQEPWTSCLENLMPVQIADKYVYEARTHEKY